MQFKTPLLSPKITKQRFEIATLRADRLQKAYLAVFRKVQLKMDVAATILISRESFTVSRARDFFCYQNAFRNPGHR